MCDGDKITQTSPTKKQWLNHINNNSRKETKRERKREKEAKIEWFHSVRQINLVECYPEQFLFLWVSILCSHSVFALCVQFSPRINCIRCHRTSIQYMHYHTISFTTTTTQRNTISNRTYSIRSDSIRSLTTRPTNHKIYELKYLSTHCRFATVLNHCFVSYL